MIITFQYPGPYEQDITDKELSAFRSLMLIVPRAQNSDTWDTFIDDVRELNHQQPLNAPRPPAIYPYKGIKVGENTIRLHVDVKLILIRQHPLVYGSRAAH